jgi:hypothetical protein
MAKKITAIRHYKPEIKREKTLRTTELLEDIAQRTSLRESEVVHVASELREAILLAHRHGRAVKIDGLGTFTPILRLDGSLDIVFRPAVEMLKKLNTLEFYAKILNKANIGKSSEELIAQWNKDHPDDPVEEQ